MRLQLGRIGQVLIGNSVGIEGLGFRGKRGKDLVLSRQDRAETLSKMLRMKQLTNADPAGTPELILVARSNATAGRADRGVRSRLRKTLFFHVIGEDQMGVVAED